MPDHKTVTFDARQWQLVPKIMTMGMQSAMQKCQWPGDGWEAALAAAPTPAAQSAGQEPSAYVRHLPNSVYLDSTGCKTRWEDLPDGTPVYANAALVNGGEREAAYQPYSAHDFTILVAENAGLKLNIQRLEKQVLELNEKLHMADLEREHFGNPDKRTGIYAERAADAPQSFLGKWSDTIKQMPMGAADAPQVDVDSRAKEVAMLVPILLGMVEGGGYDDPASLYADDFQAPDGDVFVRRAADLLTEYAALSSPAKEQK